MEDIDCYLYRDVGNPLQLKANDVFPDLRQFGFNDLTAHIYINPRCWLYVTDAINFEGRNYTFHGNQQTTYSAEFLRSIGFFGRISSIHMGEYMTKEEWKLKCCRNELDSQSCGKYYGQDFNNCGNMGCTGSSLITDEPCKSWCSRNPLQCDLLKLDFCKKNPGSEFCGCINDTPEALAERQKYPGVLAHRSCFQKSDCQKLDLVDTLITSEIKNQTCPENLNLQINNVEDSILIGSSLSNEIKDGKAPPPNYLIFVLIFAVFIIAGFSIYYFILDDDDF